MPENIVDDETALLHMESAADKAGIDVCYKNLSDDEVNIGSGLCIVRQERKLIIDNRLDTRSRWLILARELKSVELDNLFLPPLVRELIDTVD